MQLRWIILTLACVLLLAVGQLLFKSAAGQWRVDGWTWATARGFLSATMIVALVIYAIATVLWVYVLRDAPLVLAYPLFSLAFVVTPLLAHFILGEPLETRMVFGSIVIVVGVIVATS